MITHSNSFFGALGNLRNIGGSRAFSTPNTFKVEPEYSLDIDYNIQGELIAHSLDGRLWLFRRSRRLGIIALKWNSNSARLEYASALNLSNNDDVVLACGMDWVLTNNNVFLVADDEPYIRSTKLFDANIPDTFLYSILRDGNFGSSGVDPFTGEAWGKREDNGNSEGKGYFRYNTHLLYPAGTHLFEKCYSYLPAVGDWLLFENFLIRRPDADNLDSYNSMLALRPLIPLEFKNASATYGTGYNFNHRGIQLAPFHGQIWARGLYNIGRAFLLPAVFDENGEVLEFYLYICPDYPCSPFFKNSLDCKDTWLNIALAPIGLNNLFGFDSELADNIPLGTCLKSNSARLLIPENGEVFTLSEDKSSFFLDVFSHKAILLDENGALFLLGEGLRDNHHFVCNTLPQWIAPAGNIETITNDYIVASADNACFCSSLITDFNREALSPNSLPLSARAFSNSIGQFFRLAILLRSNENNRKSFSFNQILADDLTPKPIAWPDFYKEAVNIKIINSFEHNFMSAVPFLDEDYNIFLPQYANQFKRFSIMPVFAFDATITIAPALYDHSKGHYLFYGEEYLSSNEITFHSIGNSAGLGDYYFDRLVHYQQANFAIPLRASTKIFFIDPISGQPSEAFDIDFTCGHSRFTYGDDVWGYDTIYQFIEIPKQVAILNGMIGWLYYVRDFTNLTNAGETSSAFRPVMKIPEKVANWANFYEYFSPSLYPALSLHFRDIFEHEDKHYSVYSELFSDTLFVQNFDPSIASDKEFFCFYEYPYLLNKHHNSDTLTTSTQNLHVALLTGNNYWKDNNATFIISQSTISPDKFDFFSEAERSKIL